MPRGYRDVSLSILSQPSSAFLSIESFEFSGLLFPHRWLVIAWPPPLYYTCTGYKNHAHCWLPSWFDCSFCWWRRRSWRLPRGKDRADLGLRWRLRVTAQIRAWTECSRLAGRCSRPGSFYVPLNTVVMSDYEEHWTTKSGYRCKMSHRHPTSMNDMKIAFSVRAPPLVLWRIVLSRWLW